MEPKKQELHYGAERGEKQFQEAEVYVEQVLETIDNEQLRDFLVQQLKPAGFSEELLRGKFYPTDMVTTESKSSTAAAWANGEKINFEGTAFLQSCHNVLLNINQNNPPQDGLERDRQFFDVAKIQALQTFVHEQLHHLTFTKYSYKKQEAQDGSVKKEVWNRKVGLESQIVIERTVQKNEDGDSEDSIESDTRLFSRGLNEGLTELMAQQFAKEYIRQYSVTEDVQLTQRVVDSWVESGAYKAERIKIEQLAVVLAEMTEVPEDFMLKSFFHEYVTNGDLLPPEFEDVFAGYVPDGIDDDQVEAGIAAFRRSLSVGSFYAKSPVNDRLTDLIGLFPKEKADRCRARLAEIMQKYYPSAKYE